LDYDGTLTPIVAQPEDAKLPTKTQALLKALAPKIPVIILSGRIRSEVESMVGIKDIIYAGAHGYDIKGPGVENIPSIVLPVLPQMEEVHQRVLKSPECAKVSLLEFKKFGITLHFRGMTEEEVRNMENSLKEMIATYPKLKISSGIKVFEIRPNIPWDKGAALLYLLQALDLKDEEYFPMFLGDDTTDEDGFGALAQKGIGILITTKDRPTKASYFLTNPDETGDFLAKLNAELSK